MDQYRARLCGLLGAWIMLLRMRICAIFLGLCLLYEGEQRHRRRRISLDQRTFVRLEVRREEIDRIIRSSDRYCIWELRMDRNAFAVLCQMLKTRGGLVDDGHVTIEEQVATFVNILAHHNKNRNMQVRFSRSGETVSRYVHRVLSAVIRLQDVLFARPTPVPDDSTDSRWKWFKGCLGALDGTYIEVTVRESDKPRYRTRKGQVATNVLGVCTRDLLFVYMLVGWEGSATDSRVLRDAVTRDNRFTVPNGNYYLVDAGYTNGPGFLAPYRGTRYHLHEWTDNGRVPNNHEEYFNMKHSQARNCIERCFGILKKRWAILRSPSFYPIRIQGRMILACALLHNFIRMYMDVDPEENTPITMDDLSLSEDVVEEVDRVEVIAPTDDWTRKRDDLAKMMYDDWISRFH